MQGDPKVLALFPGLIKSEVSRMAYYRLCAQVLRNQGFKDLKHFLHGYFYDGNTHVKELMNRFLLLGGTPDGSILVADAPRLISDVVDIFNVLLALGYESSKDYNAAIRIARDSDDNKTAKMFIHILKNEEHHVEWFEKQLSIIKSIGKEDYLAEHIRER